MNMLPDDIKGIWQDTPDLQAAAAERKALQEMRPVLELRAVATAAIRQFFQDEGFLEVFTPVRIPTPALEDYIEAVPSGNEWLRTSPEFHMKRMLAAGYGKVFQTGPCFRREEHGTRHLTEFTMLEWYRTDADWMDVLADAEKLLAFTASQVLGSTRCHFRGQMLDLALPWETITVQAAFSRFANRDLDECIAQGVFEEVLCKAVEPNLGMNGRPTALTEYPLACSGLSAQIPGCPDRVERWEVYVAGLELGNACTELADPQEQTRRFIDCTRLRAREHRDIYKLDQPFLDAIRLGFPKTAGVAIGLDRFFMLLGDLDNIAQSNAFL